MVFSLLKCAKGTRPTIFKLSLVSLVTRLMVGRPEVRSSSPGRGQQIFVLTEMSGLTLGTNQLRVHWEDGHLSKG